MLVAFQALNNIIAHRLLIFCYGVSSDSYCYQSTNNFEKLLDQEGKKNFLIITAPIFLVFCMHIRPTRLLEDGTPNAECNVDKKPHLESIGLDWDDSDKIEEAIAVDKNNKDKKEDFQEKNRQLKREKQYQK